MIIKSLTNLINLLKNEKEYKIQIFTLENIEVFEYFLIYNRINYNKTFTSKYKPNNFINLLLEDVKFEINLKKGKINEKIILFSNERNYNFISYFFQLTLDEKLNLVKNKDFLNFLDWKINPDKVQINPKTSLSLLSKENVNIGKYISESINYNQSIIIMAVMKESKFMKIFNEIKIFDPKLDNSFLIRMELNELVEIKIITKNGDNYKLNISNETLKEICKSKGYDDIFK